MSGVYLTVWDNDAKEFDEVLKGTKGGWPHITLAYTGKHLSKNLLMETAKQAFDEWAMKPVTLSRAYVNSFYHGGVGRQRYDVLLEVEEKQEVEKSRDRLLRNVYPEAADKFGMIDPHVTAKICWSEEEAEQVKNELSAKLPRVVTVTGVTID